MNDDLVPSLEEILRESLTLAFGEPRKTAAGDGFWSLCPQDGSEPLTVTVSMQGGRTAVVSVVDPYDPQATMTSVYVRYEHEIPELIVRIEERLRRAEILEATTRPVEE